MLFSETGSLVTASSSGESGANCSQVDEVAERLWRGWPVDHPRFDDSVRRDRSRKAAFRRSAAVARSESTGWSRRRHN